MLKIKFSQCIQGHIRTISAGMTFQRPRILENRNIRNDLASESEIELELMR
jgi:hypothetical protein